MPDSHDSAFFSKFSVSYTARKSSFYPCLIVSGKQHYRTRDFVAEDPNFGFRWEPASSVTFTAGRAASIAPPRSQPARSPGSFSSTNRFTRRRERRTKPAGIDSVDERTAAAIARVAALRRRPASCLYGPEPAGSDEHVLAEAVGGRLIVPFLCAKHNSEVASSADSPFAEHYAALTFAASQNEVVPRWPFQPARSN